jgi:hypothetical protein
VRWWDHGDDGANDATEGVGQRLAKAGCAACGLVDRCGVYGWDRVYSGVDNRQLGRIGCGVERWGYAGRRRRAAGCRK